MKFLSEFRDSSKSKTLALALQKTVRPDEQYNFMEFCGGHTHAIFRYGIVDLLPPNVRMIHGPGCPVCVLPAEKIDSAIYLAEEYGVTLCTYGDLMRVPGSSGESLLKAKARGADVRMVYSTMDAIAIARAEPKRDVVFFAIGFETTTPPTATAILVAQKTGLNNFSVFCNHVLTPPAISYILESPEVRSYGTVKIDGFLGPSHVSTIIGCKPYEYFVEEYQKPVVVTGFEPLDVLQAILMLVNQRNRRVALVENQYARGVSYEGNLKAQKLVAEIFEMRPKFSWRGLGEIPYSGLRIRTAYKRLDAESRFEIPVLASSENKACQCGAILRGVKTPLDCKIFGRLCTPDVPIGPCMVSSEGACAAYFTYGRPVV